MEDAHWIDPTSLEVVKLCIDRLADIGVLAVITARPDFVDDFGARKHMTRMSLGRLDRMHVAAMVGNLAEKNRCPRCY